MEQEKDSRRNDMVGAVERMRDRTSEGRIERGRRGEERRAEGE